jgi:hypothetical protein
MSDPHADLLRRLAEAKGRVPVHPYGGLVDTEDGVRFRCTACGLLTAEQWAAACPGTPERSDAP